MEFLRDKMKYIREPVRLRVHLGYLLMIVITLTSTPVNPLFEIGTALIFTGVIIRAWASGIVKKDEELATEGPYSLCRNPLYVGNILIGFGFCFINTQLWSFLVLIVYLAIFYTLAIRKETRKMEDFFPEEFEDYREHVPMLIPRLTPYTTISGWSFEQYFSENMDFVNEGFVLLFWTYTLYKFL